MRFLSNALRALQGLYRPQGGVVATDRIDLEGSIQLVHDVARGAELASGIGLNVAPGYSLLGTAHVHAGADEKYSAFNPSTTILSATTFPVPPLNEFDIWWLGSFIYSTDAMTGLNWESAAYFPPLPGQTGQTGCILQGGTAVRVISNVAGAAAAYTSVDVGRGFGYQMPPVLLPTGTILAHHSGSTAAGSCTIIDRVWVGPSTVRPPGLA